MVYHRYLVREYMLKIASKQSQLALLLLLCFIKCTLGSSAFYRDQIEISADAADFNSEKYYANLTDYANSPLVECANLPENFYQCPDIDDIDETNCSKWGQTKYSEVQVTVMKCKVFDNIECRGRRLIEVVAPCVKYTDKYFISTLLYSIFLGMFAVDRCCIGQSGIGIGKLITLGGAGVWYIIDIILLVLGIIKPSDGSNWIPFY